jgi:hypothetical protein
VNPRGIRIFAGIQMVLSAGLVYCAWYLADIKAGSVPLSDGIIFYSRPPSISLEVAVLLLGIFIFLLALIQREYDIRFSGYQIMAGLASAVVGGVLFSRAALTTYGEISPWYYSAYLPLALGLAVLVIGFIQFRHAEALGDVKSDSPERLYR